jgi:two-component system, OmpR family, phosphate regulon response regulator PhoB
MSSDANLSIGPITLDASDCRVTVDEKPVRLTSVEFKLLNMLMRRAGQVQARDRLLSEVWGYKTAIDTRTVDTHIRRLRTKLGKGAAVIETVRGVGYRIRKS